MKKNKTLIVVLGVIFLLIISALSIYLSFNKKDEKDWLVEQAEDGNLPLSVRTYNNLEELNLKQSDVVDIYIYGNEIPEELSKEPFLKNVLVAHDYDITSGNYLSILAPEEMHFIIKCASSYTDYYKIEVKKSISSEFETISINEKIKSIIEDDCVLVEINE